MKVLFPTALLSAKSIKAVGGLTPHHPPVIGTLPPALHFMERGEVVHSLDQSFSEVVDVEEQEEWAKDEFINALGYVLLCESKRTDVQ